jgi:SAM-dependent methyltransferase
MDRIPTPSPIEREAMYEQAGQDFVHRAGAYDYLSSIAMVPRLGTLAGYVTFFRAASVLDIGCGAGTLLRYLDPPVQYTGVDISPCAIERAQAEFHHRPNARFIATDFRQWRSTEQVDAAVWAGIGFVWTKDGRNGNALDWLETLHLAASCLKPAGHVLLELTTPHAPLLETVVGQSFQVVTGCDIKARVGDQIVPRSIRVLRVNEHR